MKSYTDTSSSLISKAFLRTADHDRPDPLFMHFMAYQDPKIMISASLMERRMSVILIAIAVELGSPSLKVSISTLAIFMKSRRHRVIGTIQELAGRGFMSVHEIDGDALCLDLSTDVVSSDVCTVDVNALRILTTSRAIPLAIRILTGNPIPSMNLATAAVMIGLSASTRPAIVMQELRLASAEIMKSPGLGIGGLAIEKQGGMVEVSYDVSARVGELS